MHTKIFRKSLGARLLCAILLLSFLSVSLSGSIVAHVQAAPDTNTVPYKYDPSVQAVWGNMQTVHYGDQVFSDSNPYDNNFKFTYTTGGCTSSLTFPGNSTTNAYNNAGDAASPSLVLSAPQGGGGCKNVTGGAKHITANSVNNTNVTFYLDSTDNAIRSIAVAGMMFVDTDNSGVYLSTLDQDGCIDYIAPVTIGSSSTKYYAIFPSVGTSDASNVWDDYYTHRNEPIPSSGKMCATMASGDFTNLYGKTYFRGGGTATDNVPHTYPIILGTDPSINASGPNVGKDPGTPQKDQNSGADTSDQGSDDPCSTALNHWSFGWAVCPLLSAGASLAGTMDNIISSQLTTDTSIFNVNTPTGAAYHTAWSTFRTIGLALVIIAGLVMVISQAAGMELFDAYTVRKMLPKIFIVIVGIALSWVLLKFAVTFFNDIGNWAGDLIQAPFKSSQNYNVHNMFVSGIGGAADIGAVIGGIAAAVKLMGPMGILSLFVTILFAILIGFVTLVVRSMVVTLAIIISPLAIASYLLPGTDKLWKFWKDTFLTTMFMFPIIMGFLAVGKVMASVSPSGPVAVIAFFTPYLLLPLAFKLAGGLMSTIFSIANDKSKGIFDRQKKYRQEYGRAHRERTIGRQVLQKRADWTGRLQKQASKSGRSWMGRRALNLAARGVGGYNVEAAMSARRAAVSKELNDQIQTGQDDEIRALTVNKRTSEHRDHEGRSQYKTLGGQWVDEAAVDRAYQRWGNDTFAQQTALGYEMRKAGSEEELQGIANNYHNIAQGAGSWKMSDYEAGGAWIGAAYENQNQHLEYKSTDWHDGTLTKGFDKFVNEAYEKRGSYNLAQMGSNTIEELKNGWMDSRGAISRADTVLNDTTSTAEQRRAAADQKRAAIDRQEKIKSISETFMHELAGRQGGTTNDDLAAQLAAQQAVPGVRQTNTPGAAHTAERVRELTRLTGVDKHGPVGYYSDPNHAPTPNRKEHG